MDQFEFDQMMKRAAGATAPQGDTAPAPQAPAELPTEPAQPGTVDVSGAGLASISILRDLIPEALGGTQQGLAPAGTPDAVEAAATGAMKGVFEAKDFLFGETSKADRSSMRRTVEERDEELDQSSLLNGFSSGVGQFGIAMLGLGKAEKLARGLPWFGKGLTALGKWGTEAGKAALAGAVAFDPHEERLSNLVQDTAMANPVNGWLAADPNDSAAEGRIKSALESIGLDATILGVFLGSTKIWKALRSGDTVEAARLADQMQAEKEAALAEPQEARGEALGAGGSTVAGDGQSAPAGSYESNSDILEGDASGTTVSNPELATVEANGPAPGSIPTIVANPTDAAKAAGEQLNSPQPRIRLSDENTAELLDNLETDAWATANFGGWYQAIENGHTFGRGEGIPYVKLNGDQELDDFMARVVDTAQERLDKLKGGAVLSDTRVEKVVDQMANLFNADPAQVLGMIQQAGKNASSMVAQMEAGYLVSNRLFQDSYALANRIRLGDFSEFGGRDAALAELKKRASLAVSVYGSARSMTAAGGRAVRRMRQEFKIDPKAVEALQSVDAERLVTLLEATDGDPRGIARALNPTLLNKVVDWGQFLLINNLVSGPKTQLINILTNGYMVGARPLERMLGSAFGAARGNLQNQRVFSEAVKQYTYMGTSFMEGFRVAKTAFLQNDSVLAPHRTEAYRGNQAVGAQGLSFKPATSAANVLHNTLVVATRGIGLPTRSLGFVDELVKQTVYRSKLAASAHLDGVTAGIEAGHTGKALDDFVKAFIKGKLQEGFDDFGRATDAGALREAQVSTFQQELLPHTFGRSVQNFVTAHPLPMRIVLPFVKTPTNIIRYGWKMTPGLNLAQREYREALRGRLGAEAKMQASGQMMMGMSFMGAAAYLVSQGTITGGGPASRKDYAQRQELLATGWQPYSVVVENEDGSKTYLPLGRMDPAVVPFGIMADIMDVLHALDGEETPEVEAAIGALFVAVARQFTSKTYLMGVSQAMDAIMDPESSLTKWAGQTAANFIPFSAAMRQLNPDPLMRDARDIVDKLMANTPVLSGNLPARYNAWGDPISRVGLWSSDEDQIVDRETQRLVLESGSTIVRANPVHNGVDLRKLTLSRGEWAGRNAFEVYQQLAGHPPSGPSLKSTIARFMQSKAYQLAPDGEIGTKGTRLWLLNNPVSKYRERAMKMLKRDPVVRDAFRADDLKARQQIIENWGAARKAQESASRQSAGQNPQVKKLGTSFGLDLGQL